MPCTAGTGRVPREASRYQNHHLAGQFAGHRQAKQIGSAARRVHFIARDHVAGAHRAARRSCGRHRLPSTFRPHPQIPPGSKSQAASGCGSRGMVIRPDPQVIAGVGIAHDLARVEQVFRVESRLDGLEMRRRPRGRKACGSRDCEPVRRRARRSSHRQTRPPGRTTSRAIDRKVSTPSRVFTLIKGRMCRQPTSACP